MMNHQSIDSRDFIKNCQQKLKIDSKAFLVALQSNQLEDKSYMMIINVDFNTEFNEIKDDLTINWVNGRYMSNIMLLKYGLIILGEYV